MGNIIFMQEAYALHELEKQSAYVEQLHISYAQIP